MVYCGIQELKLMTGVMAAPGDPNSAEQGIIRTIDLLTPENMEGFRIDAENQWTPKRAQVKNGGLWVETATADGRELLAAKRGNVVETITLLLRASTMLLLNKRLAELERFALDAQNFWQNSTQIQPSYIKYWAQGAPGAQYALVYIVNSDIQMLDYGDVNQLPIARVVLTIEREYAWRGLWPGGNPIEWLFMSQRKVRGSSLPNGYDYNDMSLVFNTDHFHFSTISNRTEFVAATSKLNTISQNWIDIDATTIPGDAPALVLITSFMDFGGLQLPNRRLFIGKTTNPRTSKIRSAPGALSIGDNVPAFAIFNGGDAGVSGPTKTIDTCGVFSNSSVTNKYILTYTIGASAPFVNNMITWSYSSGPWKNIDLFHGHYAAFLRCKATNGSNNDTRVKLQIRYGDSEIDLNEVGIPTLTPSTDCQLEWALLYLGNFPLPFDKPMYSAIDGRGKPGNFDGFELELQARNTIASTRNLEFLDLILMPIDEGFASITGERGAGISSNFLTFVYDNTGYIAHGLPGDFASVNNTNPGGSVLDLYDSSQEYAGASIMLTPGVNNRLYFIFTNQNTIGGQEYSIAGGDLEIRMNIIPRWIGIRDI